MSGEPGPGPGGAAGQGPDGPGCHSSRHDAASGGGAGVPGPAASGDAVSGVLTLAIDVQPDEVRRLLGGGGGAGTASAGPAQTGPAPAGAAPAGRRSAKLEAALDVWWPRALALLGPRGAWRIVPGAAAAAAGMPEPGAWVGVGLCTIGDALEAESSRLAATDLLAALVVDAVGSAAAEAAADALNARLCAQAVARGLFAAPRLSPGYGAWDVACQERLLALLPAAALGVTLTSGQMMRPRKSVSFAVPLLPAPPADAAGSPCERCGLRHCRHRRAPA